MDPHQVYGKMVLAPSGYEPSWEHTLDSFKNRMNARSAEAKRDREAIEGRLTAPPKVIYLRDESGFGPLMATPVYDDITEIRQLDFFEEAMGG